MEFYQEFVDTFESYVTSHQPKPEPGRPEPLNRLAEAMQYSLKTGGKRFRPVLSLLTAKTLSADVKKALPVALAVEYIHTYSLIHDDLPVMDDDDMRRGQPTNHKVYGEAMALLAGDALLTETFQHLAFAYTGSSVAKIVGLVAEAAGWQGMVGGQAVDIDPSDDVKKQWIDFVHANKTGALIRVSVEAAAVACGADEKTQKALREFAMQLGFAFQLADDLLDWNPQNPENTSYVNVFGEEKTRLELHGASEKALRALEQAELPTHFFQPLIQFNLERDA